MFEGSPAETTTSFRASGMSPSLLAIDNLQHFSILNSPFRHFSPAAQASLGSTSVRKPRTPMFMARIGGSGLGIVRQVLSIVPSPPIVIMKSVFMFFKETDSD